MSILVNKQYSLGIPNSEYHKIYLVLFIYEVL